MFKQSLLQNVIAVVLFAIVFALLPTSALGQRRGGGLDPSFNGIGYTRVGSIPTAGDTTGDAAVQADGKIVIVGTSAEAGSQDFFVTRLLPGGTLDNTFNRTGKAFAAVGPYSTATAVAIQPDGKIVVGGWANIPIRTDAYFSPNWELVFALARFHPDGRLDRTFGSEGKVTTKFPGMKHCQIADIAIQDDGRIVAVGQAWGGFRMAAARYNPDGSLDQTFGNAGRVLTVAGNTSSLTAVAIQSDGKIVAVGSSVVGQNETFITVRYMPDGSLDEGFADDGMVLISYTSTKATSVVVQPDGMILVAGYWPYASLCIARYFPNGTLDTSFGVSGLWQPPWGYGLANPRLVLQSDGRVIVAGHDTRNGLPGFTAIRIKLDGSLDEEFGTTGRAFTPVGQPSTPAAAAVLQADGRLIIAGHTMESPNNGGIDVAVARFTSDGQADTDFGNGGKLVMNIGYKGTDIKASIMQPDGKIVVAGWDAFLTRINPDGTIDSSFGGNGRYLPSTPGRTFDVYSVVLQADGKILYSGITRLDSQGPWTPFITRLTANGMIDESFGEGGTVTPAFGSSSLAVQPDGKILVAGSMNDAPGSPSNVTIARYLPDGTLDTTFQNGPIIHSDLNGAGAYRMTIQPDGRIVIVGWKANNSGPVGPGFVMRLRYDGTLDRQFNRTGVLALNGFPAPYYVGGLNDVALQQDGRIVVTGEIFHPWATGYNDSDVLVARLNPNGTIDTTFGTNGAILPRATTFNDIPSSVMIQPDGKIAIAATVGGTSPTCPAHESFCSEFSDFAVLRFDTTGAPDPNWGKKGIARMQLPGRDSAAGLHLDAQGRLLITGTNRWGAFVGRLLSGSEPATMQKNRTAPFEQGLDGLF